MLREVVRKPTLQAIGSDGDLLMELEYRAKWFGIPMATLGKMDFGTWDSLREGEGIEEATEYASAFAHGKTDFTILTIAGPPGTGKCVASGTLVLSPDGRLKSIEEICLWGKYDVLSLSPKGVDIEKLSDNNLGSHNATGFLYDGVRSCISIRTRLGRQITITREHPLLTPSGWQEAKELTVGDSIAVAGYIPYFGNRVYEDYKVKLLAYLITEGGLSQAYPVFTTTDSFMLSEFQEAVELFGCRLKRLREDARGMNRTPSYGVLSKGGHISRGNYIREWLADLGLWGRVSNSKFIPDEVFTYTKEKLALFLSRLLMGDGWIVLREINRGRHPLDIQIGYSTASKILVQQVSHLFLRFGIIGTVWTKRLGGVDYHQWQVNRNDEAKKLLDVIPMVGRFKEKAERAKSALAGRSYTSNQVIWDQVKVIKEVLDQPVYDLAVPKTENFLANDIIVHNTHLALSIAWMCLADGYFVQFRQSATLLDELRRCYPDGNFEGDVRWTFDEKMNLFKECKVLIIDDLGLEKATDWAMEKLDSIIDHRWLYGLPLVITTNAIGEDLSPRIADRLRDKRVGKVVQIVADSYRSQKQT